MAYTTVLTERLGLRHPIIQAPLAGGGDTPELIAAVSEAGAFGFIGAAYLTPQQILEAARAVKARTERPFGVSLFAPLRAPEVPRDPKVALTRLAPYYAELGLAPPEIPALKPDAFPEQLAAALESGASVFSFTFGVLPADAIAAIKRRGILDGHRYKRRRNDDPRAGRRRRHCRARERSGRASRDVRRAV